MEKIILKRLLHYCGVHSLVNDPTPCTALRSAFPTIQERCSDCQEGSRECAEPACLVEKNVPVNQAGFRKGRCTTDHLVKLTSHIKKLFFTEKNTLATFFDVKKSL